MLIKPRLYLLMLSLIVSACSGSNADQAIEKEEAERVQKYFSTIQAYVSPEYNQEVAFYVDLTRPAEEERFYLLDLKEKKVLQKDLVLNGRTDENRNVIYSNEPNSNCSSKGLAKVSYRYNGRFGKSYKLVGLDPTNNNMMKRAVVLHAYPTVPLLPVQYFESQGCPTVSPDFLETLGGYIDNSPKSVLLYSEVCSVIY